MKWDSPLWYKVYRISLVVEMMTRGATKKATAVKEEKEILFKNTSSKKRWKYFTYTNKNNGAEKKKTRALSTFKSVIWTNVLLLLLKSSCKDSWRKGESEFEVSCFRYALFPHCFRNNDPGKLKFKITKTTIKNTSSQWVWKLNEYSSNN